MISSVSSSEIFETQATLFMFKFTTHSNQIQVVRCFRAYMRKKLFSTTLAALQFWLWVSILNCAVQAVYPAKLTGGLAKVFKHQDVFSSTTSIQNMSKPQAALKIF